MKLILSKNNLFSFHCLQKLFWQAEQIKFMKLNYAWTVFVYLLNNTSSLIVLNILNCLLILLILNINYKCSQYPNIVAVNFRLTNLRLKIKYRNFSLLVYFFKFSYFKLYWKTLYIWVYLLQSFYLCLNTKDSEARFLRNFKRKVVIG